MTEEFHPVQVKTEHRQGKAPVCMTMAAYEVYCHIFRPQEALVTGCCRGGFGAQELTALLYAKAFPKNEWYDRFREGLKGLTL